MTTEPRDTDPFFWLVRVIGVLVVLPVRVAWEIVVRIGDVLIRWVGRPIVWFLHYAILVPLRFMWRYLIVVPGLWAVRTFAASLAWAWEHLIAAPIGWFFHHTAPMWRALGRGLAGAGAAIMHWVLRPVVAGARGLAVQFRRWVLRPIGWLLAMLFAVTVVPLGWAVVWVARQIHRWILVPGWHGAGWVLRQIYRWLLRPVGLAIAWVWRWTVVPVARGVAATLRWIHATFLHPIAESVRDGLRALGLRR